MATRTYHGGLDGLRAAAVVAVLLYHGGVSWDGGGFLGVEVFFVPSGFLITSLLVSEWLASGTIALRAFWARRARRLLPALLSVVSRSRPRSLVELGYRDQFDWRVNGDIVHLGQAAFDAYVQRQIDEYVSVLGRGGTRVLFLSVPWSKPPAQPDGSASPAASPARHAGINALLAAAARRDPSHVQVLNLDSTVSPGNHYQAKVNGQLCRFDGVHFTLYCSELLEPSVLGTVRKMIGSGAGQGPAARRRPAATIRAASGVLEVGG